MNRTSFNAYIDRGDFTNMFVEMGWNHPDTSPLDELEIDEQAYSFKPVADKCGFHIYCCEVEAIPTQGICKKIDTHLRKYGYNYICIFREKDSTHDLWMVPVKNNEKRELVKTEYDCGAQANFLHSKIADFTFALTDHVLITDVKNKVQAAFLMNSEKVTKAFYSQFRTEHNSFATFITGLENDTQREWYTSVMLNRLMFCYFIQKKGFLDNDTNYLSNKLDWVKEQHTGGTFYSSFYKGFLCALFHDGLNNPQHDTEAFKAIYGRIPYLNGGMFDVHQLEREHQDLDIADEAFERLFAFFNKWQWHLDTRLTATGRDINPDVLGYIFEQYINDRAEMGAYYTKEDITEYIAKNCIIPFLFDRAAETTKPAFTPAGVVWSLLKNSGDRYIYDAVKKGYSPDWLNEIPDYIANGVDTTAPDLLARRARWNEKTDDPFALPTEIWRETVERFQRCDMLTAKIAAGEIHAINDFITYNLDIRQFIADIIAQTDNHRLVAHFYEAIKNITVLDPTCGSGAFIFAALNILEPLYEACLDRMEEFHAANKRLFKDELAEITDHYNSNREYFIYKSIILRNLYGVDIMIEATEIAKLRLFLKLVAVVEVNRNAPNLGLDPLPDIDFNIKCGNTLVGFTSEQETRDKLYFGDSGDLLVKAEFETAIQSKLPQVASAFQCFHAEQMRTYDDNTSLVETKKQLASRLSELNSLFNHFIHTQTAKNKKYEKWLNATKPFHWLVEFYHIMHNKGGFDVIIGNPPYINKNTIDYNITADQFECPDIYGYIIHRIPNLLTEKSKHGFIVMHNLAFSSKFKKTRQTLRKNYKNLWYSFYSRIPSGLFSGNCRVRNCIYMAANSTEKPSVYTTRLHRWFSEMRPNLFQLLNYSQSHYVNDDVIPMSDSCMLLKILDNKTGLQLMSVKSRLGGEKVFFRKTAYNWLSVTHSPAPCYDAKGRLIADSEAGCFDVENAKMRDALILLLSGKLLFARWAVLGDDFHLTLSDLLEFRFPLERLTETELKSIASLAKKFQKEIKNHVQFKLNAGKRIGNYNTSKLWHLTNISDEIFIKHLCPDLEKVQDALDGFISKISISDRSSSQDN